MSLAVVHAVAYRFAVLPSDIIGRSRHSYLVNARALAAYIMRHRYGMSYPQIGKRLGGRDHSTIIHLCRKAEGLIADRPATAAFVREHMNGPRLPLPIGAFVPRLDIEISSRVKDPATALAKRVQVASYVLQEAA